MVWYKFAQFKSGWYNLYLHKEWLIQFVAFWYSLVHVSEVFGTYWYILIGKFDGTD